MDGSKDCPECGKGPLTSKNLKPPSRLFRQIMEEALVKCVEDSCTEVCELGAYEKHLKKECPKVECLRGCGATVLKEGVNEHVCHQFWKALAENRDPEKVEKLSQEFAKLKVREKDMKEANKRVYEYTTALKSYLGKLLNGEKTDVALLEDFLANRLEITMKVKYEDLKITSGKHKTLYSPFHCLFGVPWTLVITRRDDNVIEAHVMCLDNHSAFSNEAFLNISVTIPAGAMECEKHFGVFTEETRQHGTDDLCKADQFKVEYCEKCLKTPASGCSVCTYGTAKFVAVIRPVIPLSSFENFFTA